MKPFIIKFVRPLLGNKKDIRGRGQQRFMQPEKLSQKPLDPVSLCRRTYFPAGGNSQAPLGEVVRADQHFEMLSSCAGSPAEHTLKCNGFEQLFLFAEAAWFHEAELH